MGNPSRPLGEFLVDRRVLPRDTLEEMLVREQREGKPLSRLLVEAGLVTEKDLVAAVAYQVGLRFVDLEEHRIDPLVDRLVPADLARQHLAVAVGEDADGTLVAMADPTNAEIRDAIAEAIGGKVTPAIAERKELRRVV